jgi:hypothetical protein
MIQKLQNLFHIDKLWKRILFVFVFNVLFFPVGTLVYFLFSWIEHLDLPLPSGWFSLIYFYVLLPVLSFIFLFKVRKILNIEINKNNLFLLNLIIIVFLFLSFLLIAYYSIQPNFF